MNKTFKANEVYFLIQQAFVNGVWTGVGLKTSQTDKHKCDEKAFMLASRYVAMIHEGVKNQDGEEVKNGN